MSQQKSRPMTTIDIDIHASRVGDRAKLTGASIGRVNGDVYFGMRPAQPPSEETVLTYLEQVTAMALPSEDATPELRKLWGIPFRAHMGIASLPQDLDQAVQAVFCQARQRGSFERLVLLSDASGGKTPALKYCLRPSAAVRRLQAQRDHGVNASETNSKDRSPIPIYVHLASLQPNQTIEYLLRDAFNTVLVQANARPITVDEMTELLITDVCLILLDGLEELVSASRSGGLQMIGQFMSVYSQHRYVVSCRSSSYGQQLGRLDRLFLDTLSEDEAMQVLGEDQYRALSQASQELVRNRGLLSDILKLRLSPDLLQTKGCVMQRVIRSRLEQDTRILQESHLTPEAAHGLLERLAISMWCDHTDHYDDRQFMQTVTTHITEWNESYRWQEAADTLRKTGWLDHVEGYGQWAFTDRNNKAYFAATALVREPKRLSRVLEQVSDLWWRDVFEVLVGLVPQPEMLMLDLIDRDALMAASCHKFTGETVGGSVVDALVDALIEQMGRENSSRRKFIVERLSESSYPRAIEPLLQSLYRDWSSMVVMAAAKALSQQMKRKRKPVVERAKRAILHTDAGFDLSLTKLLGWAIDPTKAKNVAELQHILSDRGQPSRPRGIAAICLGLVGTPEALQTLTKLMFDQSVEEFVAWCGIEALANIGGQEVYESAKELFLGRAYRGSSWGHQRARAAYLLGWVNQDEGDTTLLYRALHDRNSFVRGYAIDAMTRLDMRNACDYIERQLLQEKDPFVVRKAAEALGQIGTPNSIPILERYMNERRTHVRRAVRQAIAEIKTRHSIG